MNFTIILINLSKKSKINEKNHFVAKDGFEPPIARSELAVLPLHYMASLENCLSSQTSREINNIYIFKI